MANDSPKEKLKIIAYKKAGCEDGDKVAEFEALINPAQFKENVSISYNKPQAKGTSTKQLQFDKITPGDFSVDLIFDATGVLVNTMLKPEPKPKPKPKTIAEQIKEFKKVTMSYDGDTHEPYYLKLSWGELFYIGRMTSLNIVYTVFSPDGTPLRAKVSANFKKFKPEKLRKKKEGRKSPDMTHVRTVKAGDTLPLMAHRIYGDFSYYLEVARVNQLKNYRQLTPGMKLTFPPLNKETA